MTRTQLLLLGATLAVSAAVSQAATVVWTGGAGGAGTDFGSAANWTPATPGVGDTAQFDALTPGQPTIGAASSVSGINFATPNGGWTLGGPGPLTVGVEGIGSAGQTSGVNTVSVANIIVGSSSTWAIFDTATATTASAFNLSSAIQLHPTGQLMIRIQRATSGGVGTLNLSGPITGTSSGGLKLQGTGMKKTVFVLTGNNSSYSGPTYLSQATINFDQLANTGSNSSLGSSGAVTLGDNTSFAAANYTGPGGATDRQWMLGGVGGGGINNNGTGPIFFNSTAGAVTGNGNRRLQLGGANAGNNTFAGLIANAGGVTSLTKSDAGTWILANPANSYTGTNGLNGGILQVSKLDLGGNNSCIGASPNAASNLIFNNGTLAYTGSGDTCDRLFQLAGSGTINNDGSGPLNFNNSGVIAQSGVGSHTLTLGGSFAGTSTFSPALEDNGANATLLIKSGVGTWILTGANTYSGATTINGGTLLINGSLGRGPVLVGSGATLGGNRGRIDGPVTVQGGGTLALGSSISTLSLNNTLALSSTSTNVMRLNKTSAKLSSDSIRGISTLTYGGTLKVTASGAALAAGDTFQLFQAAAYNGAFASMKLPALGKNLSWDTSALSINGTIRVSSPSGIAAAASGRASKANNTLEPSPSAGKGFPGGAPQTAGGNSRAGILVWTIAGVLAVLAGLLVWLFVLLKRGSFRKPAPRQTTQAAGMLARTNSPYGAGSGQSRAGALSIGVGQSQPTGVLRQSSRSKPASQRASADANFSGNGFGASQDGGQTRSKEGFRGELREVGLQDLIQLECLNGKSSTLEVSNEELRGRIFIQGGEIVHAIAGDLSGRDAFNRLLSLTGGDFSLRPFEHPDERTIQGQWVELLMEAAYLRDKEAAEKKHISFTPSRGGTEDILAMAALLQDHPQVKEVLVCSNEGKPLHNSRCADPVQRGEVCANLAQTTKAIAELLPVGEFKQMEILNQQSRTILMAEQGCSLLVGMTRDGANLPL